MIYVHWLIGLALLFIGWERLFPWRGIQRPLREGIVKDLFYLAFNGNFFGLFLGYGTAFLLKNVGAVGSSPMFTHLGFMAHQPFCFQFITALFVLDFTQYAIHNLLHRVPFLWTFHKIHHTIEQLDWVGNWRFHWMEGLFYKSLSYIPLALFGFSSETMGWFAVASTFMGNFNHANINVSLGLLRYIFNSPRMHIWHHTHPDSGPIDRNFAIIFSFWDWIFGTAYMPSHSPERLGFIDMDAVPSSFFKQLVYPFTAIEKKRLLS